MPLIIKLHLRQSRWVSADNNEPGRLKVAAGALDDDNVVQDQEKTKEDSSPSLPLVLNDFGEDVENEAMDMNGVYDGDVDMTADVNDMSVNEGDRNGDGGDPIVHFNNEDTMPLFRFRNYGKKTLDKGKELRNYFKCTTKGCPARFHVTLSNTNQKTTETRLFHEPPHNHNPPSNPRTRSEVKEKAVAQMSAGATPANVHLQIVRNASLPLSSADVPTLAQLKNWKHAFSMKDLPTGETYTLS